MKAGELIRIAKRLYGTTKFGAVETAARGWQKKMAAELSVDRITVYRWVRRDAVPDQHALRLRQLYNDRKGR